MLHHFLKVMEKLCYKNIVYILTHYNNSIFNYILKLFKSRHNKTIGDIFNSYYTNMHTNLVYVTDTRNPFAQTLTST